MAELFTTLHYYFSFSFVRYALIVGLLIALCSSLLGVTLVLKRFSFIGDGLSHVAFGAMAVASVVKLTNNMLIVLPVTIIAAVLLLRTGQNTKIKGDAAVAMISVGALAIGYMLMNQFPSSSNISADVCSTLFGSTLILTLTPFDVWLCIGMSVVVLVMFVLFYNKIFSVTFDENFSKATGINSDGYKLLIAIITAFKSFRSVIICSAVISVVCAAAGIIISILASTPVGSTIVSADIVVFLVFWLISAFTGRSRV